MPKVSVIIPVYNVANYIERCARSLLEQTLNDMEFIFVDDASPDDSIQILEDVISHYPERRSQVHIIRHSSNLGQGTARNNGFRISKGDFIAYCDSDDYVDPNMYKLLYDKAIYEMADVVYCDFFMAYSSYNEYYNTLNEHKEKNTFLKQFLSQGWSILWNVFRISKQPKITRNIQA